MKIRKTFQTRFVFAALLAAVLGFPNAGQAQQNWKATVAGQSADMSKQAVAFLPSEIWVHAGDIRFNPIEHRSNESPAQRSAGRGHYKNP